MTWISEAFNRILGESDSQHLARISNYPDLTWSKLKEGEKQAFAEWICQLTQQKTIQHSVCAQLWNKPPNFEWRYRFLQHSLKQEL